MSKKVKQLMESTKNGIQKNKKTKQWSSYWKATNASIIRNQRENITARFGSDAKRRVIILDKKKAMKKSMGMACQTSPTWMVYWTRNRIIR